MLNFYNRLPSSSRVGAPAKTLQRIYIEPADFTKNLHAPILFIRTRSLYNYDTKNNPSYYGFVNFGKMLKTATTDKENFKEI